MACLAVAVAMVAVAQVSGVGIIAGGLASDRKSGWLTQLLLTQLTPQQILVGRLVLCGKTLSFPWAVLAFPLVFSIHSARLAPDRWVFIPVVVALACAATLLVAATAGLVCSRSYQAIGTAYAVTLSLNLGLGVEVPGVSWRGEQPWWYPNPLFQLSVLIFGEPRSSPLAVPVVTEFAWYAISSLLLCMLAWCISVRRLVR